jgi:Zn-dependent protease
VTAQDPPARPEPSPAAQIGWAIASTALLALWLGWRMGWIWAVAGVVGVFVHEYGHVLAINALGCGPGRIHIVPFLGGAATMKRAPTSEFKGVLIALAGPVFGLLAAVPFFALASATGDNRWLGGAFFIAVIGLINLAPAPPLDGSKALGPALARIHPWVERAALVLVGAAAVVWGLATHNTLFAIFVGIGVLGSLRAGALRPPAEPLSLAEWLASVGLWAIALALCLAVIILASGHAGITGLQDLLARLGL